MDIPILSLLILIPLIGAIATLFMGGERQKFAKYVAGVFAAITLVLSLYVMFATEMGELSESYTWIQTSAITINFALAVDGLSILMVFLTALLTLLVIVFSAEEKDRPNYFHTLVMAMEVGLMGVYLAADYFLFYVMWEITLIPMYFMISWYGGPRRHYAAIKFLIYTHVASLVMLIGIFAMGFESMGMNGGVIDFSFENINALMPQTSEAFQAIVFVLLFFGFMVKMPSVPFHTWLPDAHVEAPTGGSVLLAGVMLKMGSYGIIRVCLECFPAGAEHWQWVIIAIGLISMVYGAYACIAQTDLKKMVAFSSISHMGMVMVGIGCLSDIGITFAIFQMFAHGLITDQRHAVHGVRIHRTRRRNQRDAPARRTRRQDAHLRDLHDDRLHGLPRTARSGRILGRVPARLRVLRVHQGRGRDVAAGVLPADAHAHRRLLHLGHAEDPVRPRDQEDRPGACP